MSSVLGMGNALVDILMRLENDQLLNKLDLPKGSMQLVDNKLADDILDATSHLKCEQASGGSAANTIHALACLGIQTGFLGKIGSDSLGQFFKNDMTQHSIEPLLLEKEGASGKAIALISPDSERTFATFLGAAAEMSPNDINDSTFNKYKYFHIEGYLVFNRPLIEKALITAKNKGLIISLDLASYNVVEANLEFLKEMCAQYVDILFANEEESKAFTGKTGIEALNEMAKYCKIAVLKQGKNGSLIKKNNTIETVGVIPVTSVDTTGAGDLYAAGFIYGLINSLPLSKCGEIGALISGNVIEVVGPKLNSERWVQIKTRINQIIGSN